MEMTMTDKIDLIFEKVVTVAADMTHVRAKVDAVDNKVQVLNDKTIITDQSATSAHKRIDEIRDEIEAKIIPKVSNHERILTEGAAIERGKSDIIGRILGAAGFLAGALSWLFGK